VVEAVDGKRMTERMQGGTPLSRLRRHAEPTDQPLEGAVQGMEIEGSSLL
jgi:hypothetical protein